MSIKKIFALLLATVMLTAMLAACNNTPEQPEQPAQTTPSSQTTPQAPVNHIVLSSVKISAGNSAIESLAVSELTYYLAQKNIPLSDSGYPITLSIDSSVAVDGYKIEADENGLTIKGGTKRGLSYALYSFLEKIVGVHFYAADTVVIDKKAVVIGTGVLDEFVPAFQILRNPWAPIEALAEMDGGNADEDGRSSATLTLSTLTGGDGTAQPCLTDAENVAKAIQATKDLLTSTPGVTTLTFVPGGNDVFCQCESCAAVEQEEGSLAGAYIQFINAIIEAIAPDHSNLKYQAKITSRLQKAPAVTKPVDCLTICLSTADCHATHPLTDANCPSSVAFTQGLAAWVAICENVRLEYVLTSTADYLPTFANLGTLRENMRFFAESGIDSLYCSGNFVCPSGEFSELRVYLISQLLLDPMMSEEEYSAHMDAFLEGFYGAGWRFVREFIDDTTKLAANGGYAINPKDETEGEAVCGQSASDHPFTAITRQDYLNYQYLFDECWALAEELAGDRAIHVKHAAYQWRYIKLCLYPNTEDAQALIADVSAADAKISWREAQWNIAPETTLSFAPTKWIYKP